MVLATAVISLPVNMYGHMIDTYKFVKRGCGTAKPC